MVFNWSSLNKEWTDGEKRKTNENKTYISLSTTEEEKNFLRGNLNILKHKWNGVLDRQYKSERERTRSSKM